MVKAYLRELETKGVYIKKAYIYGSEARGTAGAESDIDLMLV
ncbi:MAG: nucleotidyltransferase domain-containing protein [Ignavibacteriaceae bacterium]|nr:nucleotidyltransferase domain-containing protein [Ignavibacteriaceae bacterium]